MKNHLLTPKENCGVFGVYNVPDASKIIFLGLYSLQHRGQEGAGITTSNRNDIFSIKGTGLLTQAFHGKNLDDLLGDIGIGHVRYSTTGDSVLENVQPLVAQSKDGIWAVAHNGNIINSKELKEYCQEKGSIFQTTVDSEIILHLLARSNSKNKFKDCFKKLKGSFSYLLMNKDSLIVVRDKFGFKPLVIGKLGDGYVVSSETCALNQVKAEFIREVKEGEIISINKSGLHSSKFSNSRTKGWCILEQIYFSRPDSNIFGEDVYKFRMELGRQLAKESSVYADIVVPFPDSGLYCATGYSEESNIKLEMGFIRNHYIGRTFIAPEMKDRINNSDMKLTILPGIFKDKKVILIDDSIVRGVTSSRHVKKIRDAGAKEIHLKISCPPIKYPCFFGIDFPSREELIASKYKLEEMRKILKVDSLSFLSLEGMSKVTKNFNNYCLGCFKGVYPESQIKG